MNPHTINKTRNVVYVAINFEDGLTDVTLTIRRPNGSIFNTIILTEQTGAIYTGSYIPDALGTWQEKVTSVVNGDRVVRSYDVVSFDSDDIKAQTQDIEDKVDYITTVVDDIAATVNPGGYFA